MESAQELHITPIQRIIQWRESHVTDRQFIILLSFFVGFFAAVAAYVLHWLIRQIQYLLTAGFDITTYNWLYLVFPVIGIYITSLFVRYIVKDNISHGITRVLYAISTKRSQLKGHNCWSSVIASAITIGFGGSVGAEAPIVLTGSAIGSNLGQFFKMDNKTLMLLVGSGAAAAIAGIYKAPIAGLVFTLEVLMVDLTMASLLPILISCVTATCFTYIFTGSDSLFTFHLDGEWLLERVPASILLGIFCGLISLYFIRAMNACEGVFARFKNKIYARLVLGGIVLSLLIFLFPSLYGEGYSAINILLNGKTETDWDTVMNNSVFYGNSHFLVVYIGLIILTKAFATSATNGGGGCGGTFAPSLFIGGFSGFFFARIWNINQIGVYIPEKNFTLLGMAGVMTGVMHAPLTGIFLIAELTGGYQLFMPLMIVCICSYLTINIFEPHSIYGMRLAREGKLITHHTDHAALTLMSLDRERLYARNARPSFGQAGTGNQSKPYQFYSRHQSRQYLARNHRSRADPPHYVPHRTLSQVHRKPIDETRRHYLGYQRSNGRRNEQVRSNHAQLSSCCRYQQSHHRRHIPYADVHDVSEDGRRPFGRVGELQPTRDSNGIRVYSGMT